MKTVFCLCAALLTMAHVKAQSILSTDREENVMKERAETIREQASLASSEAFANLCINYRVMKRFSPQIKQFLGKREQRKACYNFIYDDKPYKRARAKMQLDSIYQDSIDIRLIPYNKNISGEYVSFAIFMERELCMDSAQHHAIKQCALDLAHKLRKDPKLDTWPEERKVITTTLAPRQVEKLFVRKNGRKIADDFRMAWNRLKEAGLTQQLDSVGDGALAVVYLEKSYAIRDLYQRDKTARRAAMAQLDKRKPIMMRLLDGLNKKEALENKACIYY